jgi:hypothetical protein
MAHQAAKKSKFVWTDQSGLKNNFFAPRSATLNHSASISSTSPTPPQPFLQAATIALTTFNISWSFPPAHWRFGAVCHWGWVFGHPGWVQVLQSGIGLMEAGNMLMCSVAFHWCIVWKLQWYPYSLRCKKQIKTRCQVVPSDACKA